MSTRPNHLENHARELLKMPPEWQVYRWSRMPETAMNPTHTLVSGAVCTAVFKSGPRKGRTNWKARDAATDQQVLISDAEHDAWLLKWEERTGNCHCCGGDGQEWAGWSVKDGNRYRPCRRCNATGKRPAGAA